MMRTRKNCIIVAAVSALVFCCGCTHKAENVVLHLDGWQGLSPNTVAARVWTDPRTGSVLSFSTNAPSKTMQDIMNAFAGVHDAAIDGGLLPTAFQSVTAWGLPCLRIEGTWRMANGPARATYNIAFGKNANYVWMLATTGTAIGAQSDQLITVKDQPNTTAGSILASEVGKASAKLPEIQAFLQKKWPEKYGERDRTPHR